MRRIIAVLVLLALISSVSGEQNDCEKLAKDYQNIHGGDLIMIQPLKENGAYDLGEYNAHMINYVYVKGTAGQYRYYDVELGNSYSNKSELQTHFEARWNKKVAVLNVNRGEVPFAIQWHY